MMVPQTVTISGPAAMGLALLVVAALVGLAYLLARARRIADEASRGARGRLQAELEEAQSRAAAADERRARTGRAAEAAVTLLRSASSAASLAEAVGAVERALNDSTERACRVCLLSEDGGSLSWAAEGGGELHAHQGALGYVLHSRKAIALGSDTAPNVPVTAEEKTRLMSGDPTPLLLLPLIADEPQGVVVVRGAQEVDDGARMLADAAAIAIAAAKDRERLHATVRELNEEVDAREACELELRRGLQAKDEFLATVAHELRTPLNAIVGWGHILRERGSDTATREKAVEAVIRNGDRQARLIADLLDLSRVAAGKLQLEVQPAVELTSVVRAALETVRPAAESKGVRLRSTIDAEAGPIGADPHRLQQVVWNLLVNAVKFTPVGGEVAVEVLRQGNGVEIRVVDSGPGVPDELLPHVFDPFRQGTGSARTHGGLGLGLAIVRHLVELHGGRVEVRNNAQGTGAGFVVTLPPAPPEAARPASAERTGVSADELPSLEHVSVLVAARDDEARDIVSSILRDRGARVTGVASAEEAVEAVRSSELDLVLATPASDPEADVIRRLRALPAAEGGAIPAVALTSQRDERVRALLSGFQGHVGMPPEPSELVALVAALTEHARLPEPA